MNKPGFELNDVSNTTQQQCYEYEMVNVQQPMEGDRKKITNSVSLLIQHQSFLNNCCRTVMNQTVYDMSRMFYSQQSDQCTMQKMQEQYKKASDLLFKLSALQQLDLEKPRAEISTGSLEVRKNRYLCKFSVHHAQGMLYTVDDVCVCFFRYLVQEQIKQEDDMLREQQKEGAHDVLLEIENFVIDAKIWEKFSVYAYPLVCYVNEVQRFKEYAASSQKEDIYLSVILASINKAHLQLRSRYANFINDSKEIQSANVFQKENQVALSVRYYERSQFVFNQIMHCYKQYIQPCFVHDQFFCFYSQIECPSIQDSGKNFIDWVDGIDWINKFSMSIYDRLSEQKSILVDDVKEKFGAMVERYMPVLRSLLDMQLAFVCCCEDFGEMRNKIFPKNFIDESVNDATADTYVNLSNKTIVPTVSDGATGGDMQALSLSCYDATMNRNKIDAVDSTYATMNRNNMDVDSAYATYESVIIPGNNVQTNQFGRTVSIPAVNDEAVGGSRGFSGTLSTEDTRIQMSRNHIASDNQEDVHVDVQTNQFGGTAFIPAVNDEVVGGGSSWDFHATPSRKATGIRMPKTLIKGNNQYEGTTLSSDDSNKTKMKKKVSLGLFGRR